MIVKTPAKKHKTGHYRINFLLVLCANYNHNNTKTRKNKSKRQNQTSYCKNQNEKKWRKPCLQSLRHGFTNVFHLSIIVFGILYFPKNSQNSNSILLIQDLIGCQIRTRIYISTI